MKNCILGFFCIIYIVSWGQSDSNNNCKFYKKEFPILYKIYGLTIADFNNDSLKDIFLSSLNTKDTLNPVFYNSNHLLLINRGNTKFDTFKIKANNPILNIENGDIDRDNDYDIIGNFNTDENTSVIVTLINDGYGCLKQSKKKVILNEFIRNITLLDYNGDDYLDFYVENYIQDDLFFPLYSKKKNTFWLNNRSGYFTESKLNYGNSIFIYKDKGKFDRFESTCCCNNYYKLIEDGNYIQTYSDMVDQYCQNKGKSIVFDINNDGIKDIIMINYFGIKLYIRDSSGVIKQTEIETKDIGSNITYLSNADFNNDGFSDILYASEFNGNKEYKSKLFIYYNDKKGNFYKSSDFLIKNVVLKDFISISDIDNNGKLDIILSNPFMIFFNLGNN